MTNNLNCTVYITIIKPLIAIWRAKFSAIFIPIKMPKHLFKEPKLGSPVAIWTALLYSIFVFPAFCFHYKLELSNHFKLFMLTRDKILHRKPTVFITHLGVCHCSVREPALNSRDTPRLPLTHGNATKLYWTTIHSDTIHLDKLRRVLRQNSSTHICCDLC